jgi:hypothetical protein
MKQHVVAAGQGPDYDWSQDHISPETVPRTTEDGCLAAPVSTWPNGAPRATRTES